KSPLGEKRVARSCEGEEAVVGVTIRRSGGWEEGQEGGVPKEGFDGDFGLWGQWHNGAPEEVEVRDGDRFTQWVCEESGKVKVREQETPSWDDEGGTGGLGTCGGGSFDIGAIGLMLGVVDDERGGEGEGWMVMLLIEEGGQDDPCNESFDSSDCIPGGMNYGWRPMCSRPSALERPEPWSWTWHEDGRETGNQDIWIQKKLASTANPSIV
ncbi:hypothetical protein AMTR_s00182p00012110, partial [Amborella trichopoda]